jgi:hypothetical protein
MVDAYETLVKKVNEKLRAELDDATAHRENPRLVTLLETLVMLTNSEEDNEALEELKAANEVKPPSDAEIIAAYKAGKLTAKS